MMQKTATGFTILPPEEVIVRAIQFFTSENWRIQTQSARTATFVGRLRFPWLQIILSIMFLLVGLLLCVTLVGAIIGIPLIIVGVIFAARARWGFGWGLGSSKHSSYGNPT